MEPQPGPFQVLQAVVPLSDGTKAVQFSLITATGNCTVFIPPDAAREIAAVLGRNGVTARSGLTLPRGAHPFPRRP